jgi:transcriptional regulator with XRE-family HTH domain
MTKKEYQKLHQTITHRLVRAREEANLTQKQVAETAILSQSELSKLENGQRQIDFIVIISLARLYDKDLYFFISTNNA